MSIRSSNKTPETVVPVVVMRRWRGVAVGLLVYAVLASVLALYCRAEWLQAARDRNTQCDFTHAAEVSAEYWFQKYRIREWSRPGASERDVIKEMAARHRELRRKVEKETARAKKP
jgi:hypothetical protein